MESQWNKLRSGICTNKIEGISNPFLKRLLIVLADKSSGPLDKSKAYYDALACAHVNNINSPSLPLIDPTIKENLLESGLVQHAILHEEICLQGNEISSIEKDVYGLKKRRFLEKPTIDIALSSKLRDKNFYEYNGKGQQAAVRAVLTSPNDSTLFVNLPTGCGKTLLIHALMLTTPSHKLNLVIVPTIALAIEQGVRASAILKRANMDYNGPYSWHGNQNVDVRNKLKERLKIGTQHVLFCSPEAVRSSLLPTLFRLAKNDQLGALIIDEAHLVDQWGGGFRPDFQLLAPLVNSLNSVASHGIKKILMSATFSPATLQKLKTVFVDPDDKPIVINANFLRPEPTYYATRLKTQEEHVKEVLKQIRRLPRPLIIYATKQDDAKKWYCLLLELGFNRVGLFHGDTKSGQREELIKKWREDYFDIMVATSAFGVGMDKNDIKSVLHVSVPENLDRYYQESGRSGRDGRASISHLVYFEAQFGVAESLNKEKLISTDLGLKRWKYMYQSRKLGLNRFRVDLNTQHEKINYSSKRNITWNWRTLLLMQRAQFINLYFSEPKLPHIEDISEDQIKKYFEEYRNHVEIEVIKDGHLDQSVWDDKIEVQRKYEWTTRNAGLKKLKQWLNKPKHKFCELLSDFYTTDGIAPEKACGGCPGCRADSIESFTPTLGSIEPTIKGWPNIKRDALGEVRRIHYVGKGKTTRSLLHKWKHIITFLLQKGIIQSIRAKSDVHEVLQKILSIDKFWCALTPKDSETVWSELVLVMPDAIETPRVGLVNNNKLLFIPDHLNDPIYPHRKWIDCDQHVISLDDYERELKYVHN